MPTIKINEVDYDTDNFSDEARAQFSMIQYADGRLADLQGQLAVLQTAKAAYVAKLAQIVEDSKKWRKIIATTKSNNTVIIETIKKTCT